ncbi:cellulose synthase-like protein g1 [Phtheirospermum japonicum]|uniref:Cellulose synthase-like protein g1 n=1 Tax=Phtheirospermum japonicum TaxID=374723 RepID=A0A830CLC8_9LAMI|nr:cellulose synthase-like protein g1 [Phtheirospermum japonicum]
MERTSSLPLNLCHVQKTEIVINRLYMLLRALAILALFYYRITTIAQIIRTRETPILPYFLIFLAEIIFTFQWVLDQAYRWRPVTRTVYPERLPGEDKFPPIDVFVCTADPNKEPSLGVMNTVISAMALDYPPDKISVYLHDDGGSFVTLHAMREAWRFSKCWLPFCRKFGLKSRCPEAYFSGDDDEFVSSDEFVAEKKEIQKRYDEFKEILERNSVNASGSVSRDHAPTIEVMNNVDSDAVDSSQQDMPLLVYVAREKRPSQPHHFKAGALNALIRVSAVMSNAPYILILDCDHYCNDPTSARQAMCFYLDPEISPKLAFVQFPQKYHIISGHDLYDSRLNYYSRKWFGLDGVGGPSIAGCNLYLKREALYGTKNIRKDIDLHHLKKSFGSSNELIKSVFECRKISDELMSSIDMKRTSRKITGALEKEVGFIYFSVVEDNITSEILHCQGWISVWVDPPRPCFLGSSTTSLSDMLVQQARWGLGLMQIFLSKYCALIYGRGRMPILQRMCYTGGSTDPIYVVPFYTLCIVPQICLLHGIHLYPKVSNINLRDNKEISDPFFVVFAFIFLASQLKHVQEVMFFGDSFRTALYELRVWMMKSASSYVYATLGALLDKFGLQKANFTLTNKVVDDEQEERFNKGIYDFQGSPMVIAPICILYILNLASFVFGIMRIIQSREADELFVQAFISFFGIIVNYHVFEGMILRKDKGRVSPSVSLFSLVIAAIILCFGSLVLIFSCLD